MRDVGEPRGWQKEAQDAFFRERRRTWLTTATPGAGKTFYALHTARQLWTQHIVSRLYVVAPTDHLRTQWIEAASAHGFDLRPVGNGDKLPKDADGAVVTYAQVALDPALHAARCRMKPTMAILDEVHHAGDAKSWGTGVTDAFDAAAIRFLLTGTPFRSDDAKIAHVRYEPVGDDGALQSIADYTYGYGEALRDGVVRPVLFATYSADATWQTAAGEVERAMLGDADLSAEAEEAAWRTALDPGGEWIPHVFSAALRRVEHLRRTTIPDAKVIIPASNQQTAREYAAVWRRVTGLDAVVVLSDDTESSAKIAAFRDDPAQVAIVCVRMVTEGVDIKPAAVLVWSTTASTPLFFRQMVGRVIRARNRSERATVFLPRVRKLMSLAAEMERERDHIIGAPEAPVDLDADPVLPDDEPVEPEVGERWRPIGSAASLHDVFIPVDADMVGLPGLLTREQERELLTRYDHENREAARKSVKAAAKEAARVAAAAEEARVAWLRGLGPKPDHVPEPVVAQEASHATATQLRRQIANLIHGYAARNGVPHAEAWSVLYRKAPGPKNPSADLALLRRRLDIARDL